MRRKQIIKFGSKEFDELQKIWYDKLEKSGFVDVEKKETNLRTYRYKGGDRHGQQSKAWQESKIEYYDLATKFLNEYEFETRLQQIIWEYHTKAISVRDIANLLRDVKVADLQKTAVWEVIRELRQIMKDMYIK